MKKNSLTTALLRTSILTSVAAAAMSVPAFAQDEEEAAGDDRIVVTGSRIARDEFSSESPVTVVTGDVILSGGDLNLSEVLRTQLAVGTGGFNANSNLSGGGAQSIDLRNLGTDRVLNLINGRRVANFADALQNEASDLSFIPQVMIDRIEILRDGASAVYGADAVTGVVNVILKDDFEGLEVSGYAGISDESDREQYQFQAVIGGNFDRGNVVLAAEYNYAGLVPQTDRDWAIPTITFANPIVNGSGAHPGGNVNFNDGGTGVDWCTQPKVFGGDEITNVAGTSNCPASVLTGPTRYDYALVQSILNGFEVINIASYANYEITDSIKGFMEVQLSNRKSESVLDGNPIFAGSGSVSFPSGWVIPNDNPYNPLGIGGGGAVHSVTIRPTSTIGPRNQFTDATSIRGVVGLRGEDLFDTFNWELSYIYTEVDAEVTTDATFNLARAIRISDPDACALDPICTQALQPGSLGALDTYRPGNWSQSEIDYMRQVSVATSNFTLEGISGYIAGDVFDLPAGPVGIAAGFDYREETVLFRPDAVTEAGESVANQTFSTEGGYDTYEVFGEVNIPIFKDQPFFKELSLNAQGRWFDYSNFGSDAVWKVGMNWAPSDDIRVRATYGTSFRAPTLVDVFSGGTVGFQFIDDPCSLGVLSGPEGTATRLANCADPGALGVSPGFNQAAPQIPVLGGGDLADGTFDLDPETSTTWTVGVVLTPSFLDGFRFSADYWDIEVENFISTVDVENEILDVCFDSVGLSAPECALFSRDAFSEQLQGLVQTPLNRTDPLQTNGFDWSMEYVVDAFGGQLAFDHQGTFVLDYNLFPGEGNYGGSAGTAAVPEYRLNGSVRYDYSDFFGQVRVRYIPELDDINATSNGAPPLNHDVLDAHTEIDLRLGWDPLENTSLLFGVNNLTDEEPEYAFSTGTNTVPGLYGTAVVGRYFFIRGTQNF